MFAFTNIHRVFLFAVICCYQVNARMTCPEGFDLFSEYVCNQRNTNTIVCPEGFDYFSGVYGLDDKSEKTSPYRRPYTPKVNETHCTLAGQDVLCQITIQKPQLHILPQYEQDLVEYCWPNDCPTGSEKKTEVINWGFLQVHAGDCPLCSIKTYTNPGSYVSQYKVNMVVHLEHRQWISETKVDSTGYGTEKLYTPSFKSEQTVSYCQKPLDTCQSKQEKFETEDECEEYFKQHLSNPFERFERDQNRCIYVPNFESWVAYVCVCAEGKQCDDPCQVGTYRQNDGQCIGCTRGTYCPGNNRNYMCNRCPYTHMDRPIECPSFNRDGLLVHRYYTSGSIVCKECPIGFYCPDKVSKIKCPTDKYCQRGGLEKPSHCMNGEYWNETNCVICPMDSYCVDDNKHLCHEGLCPTEGLQKPFHCVNGQYRDENDCSICPIGSYCRNDFRQDCDEGLCPMKGMKNQLDKPVQPTLEQLRQHLQDQMTHCSSLTESVHVCESGTTWIERKGCVRLL